MTPHLGSFASAVGLHEPMRLTLTHTRSGSLTTCEIQAPYAIAGRWPQSAIHLDDPSVSKRHAYLQVIDGQVYFCDLASRTGLQIDGETRRSGWLSSGATMRLGSFDLQLQNGSNAPAQRPLPTTNSLREHETQLALAEIGQGNGHYVLGHQLTLLGRDKACNLRIDHSQVSRFHAVIIQVSNRAWLLDLNCGTTLNGRSVRCTPLHLGDRIGLKHTAFEVQIHRAASKELSLRAVEPSHANCIAPDAELAWQPNDPVAAALTEMRQQSMMMTQVFMKMQQEQMALMKQQMDLIQELAAPLKNQPQPPIVPLTIAANVPEALPAPASPPTATSPIPSPSPQKPKAFERNEERAIDEAHYWFMSRIGKKE